MDICIYTSIYIYIYPHNIRIQGPQPHSILSTHTGSHLGGVRNDDLVKFTTQTNVLSALSFPALSTPRVSLSRCSPPLSQKTMQQQSEALQSRSTIVLRELHYEPSFAVYSACWRMIAAHQHPFLQLCLAQGLRTKQRGMCKTARDGQNSNTHRKRPAKPLTNSSQQMTKQPSKGSSLDPRSGSKLVSNII